MFLSRAIDDAMEAYECRVGAFVYMPEHVHLLTWSPLPTPRLDLLLANIKQPVSSQVHELLVAAASPLLTRLMVRERPGKTCFRFWMQGPGYDRNLTTLRAVTASIDYIHNNPVRRGLCSRATDWKWSSARWYAKGPDYHDPDLPKIHGLPPELLDNLASNS
jgi:putative transposase